MKKTSCFLFFTIIALYSCKKDDESKPIMPAINIIDISGESDWNYCVLGEDDYYFVKSNGALPESVLFYSSEANKSYSIFFSEGGVLDKVFVEDWIISFKNADGNTIDIGLIYPNGTIELHRGLETEFDWDYSDLGNADSNEAWRDIIGWTGTTVSGVPCGLSAAFGTNGPDTSPAGWLCGNYLLRLSAEILENDIEVYNGFSDFANTWGEHAKIAKCNPGDGFLECTSALTSGVISEWDTHLQELKNRFEDVQLIDAALEYGYGDVQITLTWDNIADLDLYVIDPNGDKIYWNDKYSSSNGALDVDDIDGYGPENVFWPQNEAPSGDYEVYVHMYPWVESTYINKTGNSYYPASSNYTVLVSAFGESQKFTGSISFDEMIHVTDFDQDGLKSATLKGSSVINNIIEKIK